VGAVIDQGKRNVLGVLVDAVDYGVMTGVLDPAHNARLNGFDLVTPDGQPVRWALNLLHGAGLTDRVYGPTLTLRVLERCADEGLPIYLYGSTDETLGRLVPELERMFPALKLAGVEPSKFRPVQPSEDVEIAARIRDSGARLVLVGLGCPRQEIFAYAMRPLLDMPLMAVGAAFDYHAGQLRKPPEWMQRRGLEWLWRLGLEPRRLWRRYVILNPAYLARLGAQKAHLWRATPPPPATDRPASFAV
jgi:N-acetylglucosaminyldiphosphoundecaprenol N-acetyl-beta-D-mannosaminyltransferase